MEQWRWELYHSELYHHGILGMKWGKQQGPPYPLDASDHSAAEKKAGYKKSIGGGRNESLYDRKKKPINKAKQDKNSKITSKASSQAEKFVKYAEEDLKEFEKKGDKYHAKIAAQQVQRYKRLAEKYKNASTKEELKDAEQFTKHGFYTPADYGDYEFEGKTYNTQSDESVAQRTKKKRPEWY